MKKIFNRNKESRLLEIRYLKLEIPRSSKAGFTLIELLIVVAIIGILAALLTTNFVAIRERARDAQRKSDLRQIQSALELYRSDNGQYPTSLAGVYKLPSSVTTGNGCPTPGSFKVAATGTVYMQKIPCDPLGSGNSSYNGGNYYYYSSDGMIYTLAACIENASDTDQNDVASAPSGVNACSFGSKYFQLQNP